MRRLGHGTRCARRVDAGPRASTAAGRHARLPDLGERLAFLRQPSSYPQAPPGVDVIETHMSWVFLTERYVYKMKKPVRHDIFDFRRIDARKHFCEEELRLNRRLAQQVYLAVVPLAVDGHGRLHLEGGGTPVEWLVKMARLPAERMLDRMVDDGRATVQDIRNVARRLAAFYRTAAAVSMTPRAFRAGFLHEVARNRRELLCPAYALPALRVRRLCEGHRAFLRSRALLLDDRVRGMHVVEGHGDLRPEHVCVEPDAISIIDCLEADRRLRLVDPADETAYLALELERCAAPELALALLQSYMDETGDRPVPALVAFYQSFRACVRARLAIRHLEDARAGTAAKWRARALAYLGLAERHLPSTSSVSEPPV